MNKTTLKTSAMLSAALVASLGLSHAAGANAGNSLFSAVDLNQGYMAVVGEGKCGEGKCGAGGDDEKGGEGKCGEGKCGAGGDDKGGEGKCGEGKCGSA